MLLPYLRYTCWPDPQEFPNLPHSWPSVPVLQYQYVGLTRLVRLAASQWWDKARTAGWFQTRGYRVVRLVSFRSVSWFIHAWCSQGSTFTDCTAGFGPSRVRALVADLAARVSAALGHGLHKWEPCPEREEQLVRSFGSMRVSFQISRNALMRVGCPWKRWAAGRTFATHTTASRRQRQAPRLAHATRDMWEYQQASGPIGVLLLNGSFGKLVRVMEEVVDVDASAISASIDGDAWFSRDAEPDLPKWGAVRIHSRCRMMGAAEACNERVGSIMHHLWHDKQIISKNALMDNVLLTEAQVTCIGNERDEMLCRHVAEVLRQHGLAPICQPRSRKKRKTEGIMNSMSLTRMRTGAQQHLQLSGRSAAGMAERSRPLGDSSEDKQATEEQQHHPTLPQKFPKSIHTALVERWPYVRTLRRRQRTKSAPAMSLPTAVDQELHALVSHGKVAALPMFGVDQRKRKKDLAESSLRERFHKWLESPEGKEWQREKAERHTDT